RGRKKVELHGKLCGGNEFISNWIWLATGMSLVSENPEWKKKGRKKAAVATDAVAPEYESPATSRYARAVLHNPDLPRPSSPMEALPSSVPQAPTIQSVKFTMLLRGRPIDPTDKISGSTPLAAVTHHTFTSIYRETGSALRALEDVPHWRSSYPMLRPYDQACNTAPIFLFEAGLRLMDEYPGNTRIEIDFDILFSQGACYQGWHSRLQAYDELGPSKRFEFRNLEGREPLEPKTPHRLSQAGARDNQTLTLKVPFRAEFWRDLFCNFRTQQLEAYASGDSGRIRDQQEHPRRYLSKLSVMQELWATPNFGDGEPRCMARLLWKFHQTHGTEVPTTSWRRLTPPASLVYHAPSPMPPQLQPPINFDRAVPTDLAPQQAVARPYAWDYDLHHPNAFFTANPEQMLAAPQPGPSGGSSPVSGVAYADEGSFPSSTSTSFPSSISNPAFPTVPYPHSYSGAMEGSYPCLGSFTSQSSAYHTDSQEYEYPVHETMIQPRAGLPYDMAETLYHAHDSQHAFSHPEVAGYAALEGEYENHPIEEATEVQLAWAQRTNTAQSQRENEQGEGPMIAPRAHITSQHPILQLQDFDELQAVAPHREDGEQRQREDAAAAATQLLGFHEEAARQSDFPPEELDQPWTLAASPWAQQDQPYQHSSYAQREPSREAMDGWYDGSVKRMDKSVRMPDMPLDPAMSQGAVAGYERAAT
ncbi:MAG: hypothetical protein Q9163_006494, partial [Psora crenata]